MLIELQVLSTVDGIKNSNLRKNEKFRISTESKTRYKSTLNKKSLIVTRILRQMEIWLWVERSFLKSGIRGKWYADFSQRVHSIIWQNPLKHGINRVPEKFNIFLNFAQDQHAYVGIFV